MPNISTKEQLEALRYVVQALCKGLARGGDVQREYVHGVADRLEDELAAIRAAGHTLGKDYLSENATALAIALLRS